MTAADEPDAAASPDRPPAAALSESFTLASGPGGQNVNKVETAVQLRLRLADWPDLPQRAGARLRVLAGSRLTKDDDILIISQRFRSREANRLDARARLAALLERAFAPPPPPRVRTRPTKAAKARRVDAKTRRGAVKALRGRPSGED